LAEEIHRSSVRWQWRNLEVIHHENSIYGFRRANWKGDASTVGDPLEAGADYIDCNPVPAGVSGKIGFVLDTGSRIAYGHAAKKKLLPIINME